MDDLKNQLDAGIAVFFTDTDTIFWISKIAKWRKIQIIRIWDFIAGNWESLWM